MTLKTLMVVDDDQFVRTVLKDALAALPLRIVEATDGEQALALAEKERPDAVLLDLFMPHRSGLQVLADLRDHFPNTRVVVVSSMDSNPLVKQALEAGAAGFIAKPFHPVEIVAAVTDALKA